MYGKCTFTLLRLSLCVCVSTCVCDCARARVCVRRRRGPGYGNMYARAHVYVCSIADTCEEKRVTLGYWE